MTAPDWFFWEKPVEELTYYQKLRRGICPECNSVGSIFVEADYEYVTKQSFTASAKDEPRSTEVKQYHTGMRCSKCGKAFLPTQLLPMAERFE